MTGDKPDLMKVHGAATQVAVSVRDSTFPLA
jgi:hypothetical protein